MGRRAKKAPVVTKKRPTLDKRFKCPFCANEGVVECKMDFKEQTGSLSCRLCNASYQMPIHNLHEPIDVFSEWLDDCEAAANQQRGITSGGGAGGGPGGHPNDDSALPRYQDEFDEEEDIIDDDDDIPDSAGLKKGSKQKSSSQKKSSSSGNQQQTSYANLGLDDSEDSDDD